MEMVGVLLSKAFDKLFRLPGRSAIDALASWMGPVRGRADHPPAV